MVRAAPAVLIGTLLFVAAPAAHGGDEPAEDCVQTAVQAIQRRYEQVRDLRSDFVQTTRSVALGGSGPVSESRGTVIFAKPGTMRWSYEEPEPSLVVSDGEWIWIYDPSNREVQRMAVGAAAFSGAAIQFLLGEGDIDRDFAVRLLSCAETEIELELTPRRPASFEKLRVRTDPARGDLTRTEIVDLLGNVTTVSFSATQANLDPAAEIFRFEPPDGVRVIDLGPAVSR